MPFSVSEIIVCDTTQKVVALNWSYENADGKVGNQWQLSQPYGDTPLASCTEGVLVQWLQEQLPNTTEDFDKQIADNKARAELEQTLQPFTPHPAGPPTPVTQDIVDPEESAPNTRSKK